MMTSGPPPRRRSLALTALGAGLFAGACMMVMEPDAPSSPPAASLEALPAAISLEVGQDQQIVSIVRGEDGRLLRDITPRWASTTPTVATVTSTGLVTAVGLGTAKIIGMAEQARDTVIVTVTPVPPPVIVVTTVEVVPPSLGLAVGEVASLQAVVRDQNGAQLFGRSVSWSSETPQVAQVSPTGAVTAVDTGTARIVASVEDRSGASAVTVFPRPEPGSWPHAPSGYPTVSDQPWNVLTLIGWQLQFGTVALGLDPTAPGSPPSVLTILYPIGFVGGSAPGTEALTLPRLHEVYVGTWWKPSSPWQGHPSNSNKVQYLFTDGAGSMAMIMYGTPGGPYEMRVFPDWQGDWLRPNVNQVPIELGRWHQLEWQVIYGPTQDPPSGIVRWWMDGVLLGDYSNVRLSPQPFIEYKVAPVWGGAEPVTKLELDFFQYDHTFVTGR